jgi:outer membrane receptor protein involved in Fe transport
MSGKLIVYLFLAFTFFCNYSMASSHVISGKPIPSDSSQREAFQQSEQVMDTVMVTGRAARNPVARPKTESSGLEPAISVVDQEEITRQGAKTVMDALEYIPGAWVETRGRKVKQFFSIRGQKYPYPDYALDGAWQREFLETPYFFPSGDVERIEIMRSSAALLTGLSGLAGVVNIIPRWYGERETSVRLEYGSFNTSRLNLNHGGTYRDLSYVFGAGRPRTQGPENRHAEEGITHFRGSLAWNPNPEWSVTTHFLHLRGHRELARAQPPAAERFRENLEMYDPLRSTLLSIKTLYRPGEKTSTEFVVNYSGRDHLFVSQSTSPHQSTEERDYEWSTNLTQSLMLRKDNVLRIGALYNHWVAPNGKRFYTGKRCDLETYSAVLVDEQIFGPLSLDAGLRWARTYINQYGAFNIEGSPKGLGKVAPVTDQWEPSVITTTFGASYSFSHGLSLHFNLSSGTIEPRRGTLDINLEEPATERRIKVDLGVQAAWEALGRVSLAGFLTERKDAIALSGQTETLENRVMELYLNRDQDQLGVEIDARSMPLKGNVQLFFNFLAMRSRAETGGEMLRDREMPRFIASGGFYTTKEHLDFNLLWKFVSGYESTRFAEGAPPLPQPLGGYHSLNITTGWTFGVKPVNRAYFEIVNLTNENYSTVVGYPDYGRRFTVGLHSSFK